MKLPSYPKVWNLGHPRAENLFQGAVVVQEKIDGSQFSFGVVDGVLYCRSKGAVVHPETTDRLFRPALDTAAKLFESGMLKDGWVYRGETLRQPKHNTIEYSRAPHGNIILFDIDTNWQGKRVIDQQKLHDLAEDLRLETVAVLYEGEINNLDSLMELMDLESSLGGSKIEGIVIKNYDQFTSDGKQLMGKYVSEKFKETNEKDWRRRNPSKKDVVQMVTESVRTEARWHKAIQHLRDSGELEMSPRDIGPLLNEIQRDVDEEESEWIKSKLYAASKTMILRGACYGFPQWYKDWLAAKAFDEQDT